MKRILTGDRPTGPLHLGHYVGSLQNRIKLQDEGYELFNIIADFQVLTDRLETDKVEENIKNLTLDYLSLGLDPKKTSIFIQSKVPQLSELFMYLSMLVNTGRVAQNPTVKEEAQATGGGVMSLGMFSLGVSQAADILAFNADIVPVGEDQLPHIEQTRDLARSFNSHFGNNKFSLKEPRSMISVMPRLAGLDTKNKMSKSRNNAIFFTDTKDEIVKKIKSAVTDSEGFVGYGKEGERPEISNLVRMYAIFDKHKKLRDEKVSFEIDDNSPNIMIAKSGYDIDMDDIDKVVKEYEGLGYKEFKEGLAEVINNFLDPIREKRAEFEKDEKYVSQVLKEGTEKAIEEAEKTMKLVRGAMKYDYPTIFK